MIRDDVPGAVRGYRRTKATEAIALRDLSELLQKGRTAIEEGHAAVHGTVFRNSAQRELLEELTVVGADAAVVRFYSTLTGDERSPDKIIRSRKVLIVTKREGVWRVDWDEVARMRLCACAVLTDGARILLGKRSPNRRFYPGVWDVVGGHVRAGESIQGALVREVAEEVGVVPSEYDLVDVLEDPHPEENGPGQYHFFVVRKWAGSAPRLQNDEHSELGWFSIEEACELDLADPSYKNLFAGLGRLLAKAAT